MKKKYFKKFCFLSSLCFLLLSLVIGFVSAIHTSDVKSSYSYQSCNGGTSVVNQTLSNHILHRSDIKVRTNWINKFTSVKTSDKKYEYALCDILDGSNWTPGIVVLDSDGFVSCTWNISEIGDSSSDGRKLLPNNYTSNICIGSKDTEIFVLLAVKDLALAINQMIDFGIAPTIYVLKIEFVPDKKQLRFLRKYLFAYPRVSQDIAAAWFSLDGLYYPREERYMRNVPWGARDRYNSDFDRVSVGYLGILHFLTYGHFFSYVPKSANNNSLLDSFIMAPGLITFDPYAGGLYSPVLQQKNNKISWFSKWELWKTICDDKGDFYYKDAEGKVLCSRNVGTSISSKFIQNLNTYFRETKNRRRFQSRLGVERELNLEKSLLLQPGWCLFSPDETSKMVFISPSYLKLGATWNASAADMNSAYVQFDVRHFAKGLVVTATKVSSSDDATLAPTENFIHFNAPIKWFFSSRKSMTFFGTKCGERNSCWSLSSEKNLDKFFWNVVEYKNLLLGDFFDFHAYSLTGETKIRNDSINFFNQTCLPIFSSPLYGNVSGVTLVGLGESLVLCVGESSLEHDFDLRNFSVLKQSNRITTVYHNIGSVEAILPFMSDNWRSCGVLIISQKGMLSYRILPSHNSYDYDNNLLPLFPEKNSSLSSAYFYSPSQNLDLNLVNVTLTYCGNQYDNCTSRVLSLQWNKENVFLRPLLLDENTKIIVRDDLPSQYEAISTHDLASMNSKMIEENFAIKPFFCKGESGCNQYEFYFKHISSNNENAQENKIALFFKVKLNNQEYECFVEKFSEKSDVFARNFAIYSGLSNGQKYLVTFKSRSQVKKMDLSRYRVDEILELYNSPKNEKIQTQLDELISVEPSLLKKNWKTKVHVVDANYVNNTLSLQALLVIDKYLEPLRLKGSENTTVYTYSDVFHKTDNTWIYIALAVILTAIIVVSLGLGIGLPMRKQAKINMINARLTNKRIERLTDAMSASMKKIIDITSSTHAQQPKALDKNRWIENQHDVQRQAKPPRKISPPSPKKSKKDDEETRK